MISRSLLALALAAAAVVPLAAHAANDTDLTIYRSDNNALFSSSDAGAVDAGHAVVHEQRSLHLQSGTHDLVIGNLPDFLDPEAVNLGFGSSKDTVISQRLLLPASQNGTLSGHIGKSVTVLGSNGRELVKGKLEQVTADGGLVIGGDVFGPTVVRDYAAVKLIGGEVGGGTRLEVRVKAKDSGNTKATLTYPSSGLGWRGAYTGMLASGNRCRMDIRAMASIANRSGREWTDADVKLVAGSPNFAKNGTPRPMMMKAMSANAEAQAMPAQNTLGDYRTYTLPGAVTLPEGSITLTPLYKPHTVSCERTWVFENGNTAHPSRPITRDNDAGTHHAPVVSTLAFTAFDSFPAGYLRVLTQDKDGSAEFLGEGRISDTPKGQKVRLTLGTAFDLTGTRERTRFNVDQRRHSMDEAFRITLTNAGDTDRTITVREHPSRWRNWTLTSSSIRPSKQTPDELAFKVTVPAKGKATLDYAVHYSWTAADER
jgi:hypothetical protein